MPDKHDFRHGEEDLAQMKHAGGPPAAQVNAPGNGNVNNSAARVQLQRTALPPQNAQLLWIVIRNRTIDFNQYKKFIDGVMCCTTELPTRPDTKESKLDLRLPFPGVRAYNLLKLATELYLMQECGVFNFGDADRQQAKAEFLERFDEQAEENRTGRDLTVDDVYNKRNDYLVELKNDLGNSDGWVLPYFEVIRQKLEDIPLKYFPPN